MDALVPVAALGAGFLFLYLADRRAKRRGSARRIHWTYVLGLVWVVTLALFGVAVYPYYRYHTGTVTTATIQECNSYDSKSSLTWCGGTWSVGGQSHTGVIEMIAHRKPAAGSQLAVHVRGDNAYSTALGRFPTLFAIGFAIATVIFFVRIVWQIRRSRKLRIADTGVASDGLTGAPPTA